MIQRVYSIDNLTVVDSGCNHPGLSDKCVTFEGGKHISEVNVCNYVEGGPVIWRLECGSCFTVLKIFDTYDEAIRAGKIMLFTRVYIMHRGMVLIITGILMTEFRYLVIVTTDTREHADQVMGERLNYDEDFGFDYTIDRAVEITSESKIIEREI